VSAFAWANADTGADTGAEVDAEPVVGGFGMDLDIQLHHPWSEYTTSPMAKGNQSAGVRPRFANDPMH
jgi:hypothetical protein